MDTITETCLLGTIVTNDLTWQKNTQHIIQKGYQRMLVLINLYSFNVPDDDLVLLYCKYIRSVLEFNSNVWYWYSSITQDEKYDLERVQKVACRIIIKDRYMRYGGALKQLGLQTLDERKTMLSSWFAIKCIKHERFSDLSPRNEKRGHMRHSEEYQVKFART